jgi:hypothetical protein
VDLLQAASIVALGVVDGRVRRTTLTDAVLETTLAVTGGVAASHSRETLSAVSCAPPAGHKSPRSSRSLRGALPATQGCEGGDGEGAGTGVRYEETRGQRWHPGSSG